MAHDSMKIERSPRGSYPPYLPLAEAFDLVKSIYEQGGGTASYDLMSRLTGNSGSSSSFNRKLAALRWYGFVIDQDNKIILTELGNAVAAPQHPESAANAKKNAFLNIEVFGRIYERHKGKLLPADEFLKNIIEQDCKVPRALSEQWITAFKDAAKAAELLLQRADGKTQILESPILSSLQGKSLIPAWNQIIPKEPVPTTQEISVSVPFSASGHCSKIEVSGGRYAEFRIPDRLTERDAQKIKKALTGYEALLDSMVDEFDPSKNGQ